MQELCDALNKCTDWTPTKLSNLLEEHHFEIHPVQKRQRKQRKTSKTHVQPEQNYIKDPSISTHAQPEQNCIKDTRISAGSIAAIHRQASGFATGMVLQVLKWETRNVRPRPSDEVYTSKVWFDASDSVHIQPCFCDVRLTSAVKLSDNMLVTVEARLLQFDDRTFLFITKLNLLGLLNGVVGSPTVFIAESLSQPPPPPPPPPPIDWNSDFICHGQFCSVGGLLFRRCVTTQQEIDFRELTDVCWFYDNLAYATPEQCPANHRRNMLYWWFAVNIYSVTGARNRMKMPICILRYVRRKEPNAPGVPYCGHQEANLDWQE
eukprot:Lithocolla_globosa_v1_NODE_262_length_4766_cov_108.495648.p1 type:complete len:320 gc:universal NODE_262_length_4766_cov_108.495648:2215-3174(+)